jgi:hypothetical protein
MLTEIINNISRLMPKTISLDEIVPTCRRCYQPLESKEELDLNRNPEELCCDCMAQREALYNWEIA